MEARQEGHRSFHYAKSTRVRLAGAAKESGILRGHPGKHGHRNATHSNTFGQICAMQLMLTPFVPAKRDIETNNGRGIFYCLAHSLNLHSVTIPAKECMEPDQYRLQATA